MDALAAAARDATDGPAVVRTGPTGVTAHEPLLLATRDGRTAFHPGADRATAARLAESLADGALPTADATAVVTHDPGTRTLPVPETGPLSVGRRRLLGPCGWVAPLDPDDHRFLAGDVSLPTDTGLRGRGRGDVGGPVVDTWATVRETAGDPVVVVNANESRSESRADRTLLAGAPLRVLDGVAAVAEGVGATDAVVYLNGRDEALVDHLRAAVDAAEDLAVVPQLVAGPDSYRAGAPTAALEALEGADRIEPRLQPPSPAEHGLYGRPTAVHTPRTFAAVRAAMGTAADDGTDAAEPDTRVFSVVGDVADPAVVELPTDGTLAAVHEAVTPTAPFGFAVVGGVLGGVTRDLDRPPAAAALSAAGLGTDGVVELLAEDRCVVAEVGERARFASEANAGRCVPGREGTVQLAELLRDVYDGEFDPDAIRELARTMRRTSNCPTGAHAPRPVTTAIDAFEPSFRAHSDGRCPTGRCSHLL